MKFSHFIFHIRASSLGVLIFKCLHRHSFARPWSSKRAQLNWDSTRHWHEFEFQEFECFYIREFPEF